MLGRALPGVGRTAGGGEAGQESGDQIAEALIVAVPRLNRVFIRSSGASLWSRILTSSD